MCIYDVAISKKSDTSDIYHMKIQAFSKEQATKETINFLLNNDVLPKNLSREEKLQLFTIHSVTEVYTRY